MRDIVYIQSNFSFLSHCITKLEAKGKSLQEQISIIKEAETKVKSATGRVNDKVRDKWNSVLRKNPGFSILNSVCDVMNGEDVDLPEQISMVNIAKFK